MSTNDLNTNPPFDKSSLSQVPSWVLVGFLVGVVTMWFFYRGEPEVGSAGTSAGAAVASPEAPPAPAAEPAPANPLAVGDKPSLEMVGTLFASLRDWAFWTDDRTEIAVWNSSTGSFSDHFEVLRTGDADFFRPIPALSRLPIEGYGPPHSPILFTETVEQRRRRYYFANPDKVPQPGSIVPLEFKQLPPPPTGGR